MPPTTDSPETEISLRSPASRITQGLVHKAKSIVSRLASWSKALAKQSTSAASTSRWRRRGRLLWSSGRPILFLAALCLLSGLPLAAVSIDLGLVFIAAGAGALGTFLYLLERADTRGALRR
jgi:hypothetical protein